MKLSVLSMKPGDNPFRFESSLDSRLKECIHRLQKQGFEIDGPLCLTMNIVKLEPNYYLRARMEFRARQLCSRCAESFVLDVQHAFDAALARAANVKNAQVALADESDELDVYFFEGNELDLGPMIDEQFILSLPYQPLCQADCQGICQRCGTNLNLKSCQCPRAG